MRISAGMSACSSWRRPSHVYASPRNLRVDLMDEQQPPLMLVTASGRPSFSFVVGPSIAGSGDPRMTHYRVVVSDFAGAVAWASRR